MGDMGDMAAMAKAYHVKPLFGSESAGVCWLHFLI